MFLWSTVAWSLVGQSDWCHVFFIRSVRNSPREEMGFLFFFNGIMELNQTCIFGSHNRTQVCRLKEYAATCGNSTGNMDYLQSSVCPASPQDAGTRRTPGIKDVLPEVTKARGWEQLTIRAHCSVPASPPTEWSWLS